MYSWNIYNSLQNRVKLLDLPDWLGSYKYGSLRKDTDSDKDHLKTAKCEL